MSISDTSEAVGAVQCAWCRGGLSTTARIRGGRFCGKRCRQAAHRLRRQSEIQSRTARALRVAYADPPYPGLSKRYYEGEPSYAGEVDHVALVAQLTSGAFDGWALSTSGKASVLRELLPLCPPDVVLCPWVKPHGVSRATRGPHNAWEAVIVMPARREAPGVRDWLRAMPARGDGELMGRKPLAFCAMLFRWLGLRPGDELVDLFPGTGAVSRAWTLLSGEGGALVAGMGDASARASDDASRASRSDAQQEALSDASPMEDR